MVKRGTRLLMAMIAKQHGTKKHIHTESASVETLPVIFTS
jgi:hypothetical protein